MSAVEFQKALALLIRLPEDNRGSNVNQFLSDFDLSEKENEQLVKLAADYNLQKFGRIMRGSRWDGLKRQMKIIHHFINERVLEDLCLKVFEPHAAQHTVRYYPVEFTKFLMTDEKARGIVAKNGPAFIFDMIKYEHAQLQFRRQVFDSTCPLPGDTLLNHRCFRIVHLGYDIPQLLRKLSTFNANNAQDVVADKRDIHLLMLGDLEIPKFKTFELDHTTATFLERLLSLYEAGQPLPADLELPESYSDLVEAELCKPITKH